MYCSFFQSIEFWSLSIGCIISCCYNSCVKSCAEHNYYNTAKLSKIQKAWKFKIVVKCILMVFSRLGGLIQDLWHGLDHFASQPFNYGDYENKELACFKLPNEDNICNIVTVYIIYSYRGCITLVSWSLFVTLLPSLFLLNHITINFLRINPNHKSHLV